MFAEIALTVTTAGWATTTAAAVMLDRRLHTDALTGLANRTALYRRARRTRRGLVGLLLIDLDQFKAINDTHGHDFGNKVLAAVGTRLDDATEGRELAVRLHGDEFALWLGRVSSPAHAEERAQQITAALSVPLWIDGHRLTALGSVGVAVAPARSPLGELLGDADRHMYAVKANRRLTTLPTSGFARPRRDLTTPPDLAA
ncbi:diguanylate cyclase (GGDEF) domain-containing protein [Saccharopolyspora antimicrobica]|uniref:Diguanylate cyclase (GGDEF) domain-containing protein n=1 Tax=Saccharopolyspora antimicrobica TaxID=455193 RepID=A0A1I4QC42_9PSEU|nr:GGDEF domain-containing protein [Saccharopolyspora antimicrobica]RKT84858.1 diguanylate cyclase (GGDEF)-like protein [Saccharopolyspora antimicrobica]SFM37366.1 diguanylate cyclase (GGDEF) domain-containing protein [Saccharopolyspora antimicrobica]